MIRSDFHTHTTFSTDGISSLSQMCSSAIRLGLERLCITEHMDYDNHMGDHPDIKATYPGISPVFVCDTDKYHSEYLKQSEQLPSNIELLFGIELGLQPQLGEHYEKYVDSYPFDFVIGSQHEAQKMDPYYPEYLNGRTPKAAYRAYFEEEVTCAKANLNAFDVFGHIDYALRYNRPEGYEFSYSDFADELDTLLKFLIENGKGIELNTGGFSYFKTEPNPRISILKRYIELGGEIITVGSDAHKTSDIARHFDIAEEILKGCGFKYYTVFKGRAPRFINL